MNGAEQLIGAISTVGFPIAAACGLFYLYDKTMNSIIVTLRELTDVMRDIKNDLERKDEVCS